MEFRLSLIVETVRITAVGLVGPDGKINAVRFELESTLAANNPAIATFVAAVDANFAKIQAGILALDKQIQAFNNSPGTLSAADQAQLDAIVAASATLAAAANAPVTAAVPPPAA